MSPSYNLEKGYIENAGRALLLVTILIILFLSQSRISAASTQLNPSQHSATLGLWVSGTPFSPGNTEVGAAGAYNSILYYIGGQNQPSGLYTNQVFLASIHSDGSIGKWVMSVHSYPGARGIWALQCPAYNGFVYCIGGNKVPGGTTNAVYYSTIGSTGLGVWKSTASYPIKIRFESCVPYDGYMYCVGGSPDANFATNSVYYAQILSQGGLGTWYSTTSYPMNSWAHCVISSGYIFCLSDYNGKVITNPTFYAQVSSSGVGPWKSGPQYPITKEKMQCAASSNSIFCIGGGNGVGGIDGNQAVNNVYAATISSSGFGRWQPATSYPIAIKDHACATYNGFIYCVGGDDPKTTNAVYFAQVV